MEADDSAAKDDCQREGHAGIGIFCQGYRAGFSYGQFFETADAMAQSLGMLSVDSRLTGCGDDTDIVHMAIFHDMPIGPERRRNVIHGERFCPISRL
jgi:hypothetical protein